MIAKRHLRLLLPVIAVVTLAAALNLWAVRYPARIDLTNSSVYSISAATRDLLASVDEPVEITFFYDVRSRAMQDARYLLEQYEQLSPQISLASHDPTLEPAVAERFGVKFAGTAVFSSGRRRVLATNPGEVEFSNALIRVTSDAIGRVCFTDGHIESNPDSRQSHDHFEQGGPAHNHATGGRPLTLHERHGMGMARNALETLGYTVEQRLLFKGPDSLDGCALVIVASPQAPFSEREANLLGNFIDGGGPALFMLEPDITSGLEDLLATFGIAVSHARIMDPERHYWTDSATPAITDYPRHSATRALGMSFFPGVAELMPHPAGVPTGVNIVPLAETSSEALLDGVDHGEVRARTVILTASRGNGAERIAVTGDGDFATNSFFAAMGNGQLFLNLVSELTAGGTLIDIAPREYVVATLRLSNMQLRATFLVTAVIGPVMMLAIGAWVMWRRG